MRNPLTGHAVDQYITKIQEVLASNPVDGADLLSQLQAYDAAPEQQDGRIKQALRLYANVRLSSTQDVQLIDEALSL